MKRKNEVNCTALGVSNMSRIMRMNRAGAAGVFFTALGLILTAVSYTTHMGGTIWLTTEDDDAEGRAGTGWPPESRRCCAACGDDRGRV